MQVSTAAPIATYRLQFGPSLRFDDAKRIVPYLAKLGISHIYASPIFKARKGSTHGYDVTDPRQLNPELGTMKEFEDLIEDVRKHGMGWVQDIVPNHMAYSSQNPMISDLLQKGDRSRYFRFFDIQWNYKATCFPNPLLAPFLADRYSRCLERGEIELVFSSLGFEVKYFEITLPINDASYALVLKQGLKKFDPRSGDNQDLIELRRLVERINTSSSLCCKAEAEGGQEEGESQAAELKERVLKLFSINSDIKEAVERSLQAFKGEKGKLESFLLLDRLLSEQYFKLTFWRSAREEINYRRFFTISDLISVREEDLDVFDQVHSLIFDFIDKGWFDGLRVDHIDGLWDPAKYIKRIRNRIGNRYLVVEKILAWDENLPTSWPTQGTTGYDFLSHMSGLFCDADNMGKFDRIYSEFTGLNTSYKDIVYLKKRQILERQMNGDVDNLIDILREVAANDICGRDMTAFRLRQALVEALCSFEIYRTYISSEGKVANGDRYHILQALWKAKERNPGLADELIFLGRVLLLEGAKYFDHDQLKRRIDFDIRFQQLTCPLMAKGFEDTVLYFYNRLLSLNNVGGSPDRFGTSIEEFHEFNLTRAKHWAGTMNATSTHDTKRGEDAAARINVLSEVPDEWDRAIKEWTQLNDGKKRKVRGQVVPDKNEEYFLYQTLIGALPMKDNESSFCQRIEQYLVKALREAKVHSHWANPDTEYEPALILFLREILRPGNKNGNGKFIDDLMRFHSIIYRYGILNSLSQVLIKITAPGVPDFYQGTELWDYSFVDPDNRRPVDFTHRISLLDQISCKENKGSIPGLIADLLAHAEDGRVKLFLIHRAIEARWKFREVFSRGSYIPLRAEGDRKENVVAFARTYEGRWSITLAPRLAARIMKDEMNGNGGNPYRMAWKDTFVLLPPGCPNIWSNAITTQMIEVVDRLYLEKAFDQFPVALLLGGGEI